MKVRPQTHQTFPENRQVFAEATLAFRMVSTVSPKKRPPGPTPPRTAFMGLPSLRCVERSRGTEPQAFLTKFVPQDFARKAVVLMGEPTKDPPGSRPDARTRVCALVGVAGVPCCFFFIFLEIEDVKVFQDLEIQFLVQVLEFQELPTGCSGKDLSAVCTWTLSQLALVCGWFTEKPFLHHSFRIPTCSVAWGPSRMQACAFVVIIPLFLSYSILIAVPNRSYRWHRLPGLAVTI